MIYHNIEQYGYIYCRDGKKYVFEDIKKDTKYYKIYPQIENKSMNSVKTHALKMLLDKNDIVNAAGMISEYYDRAIKEICDTLGCSASVSIGCEKTVR